MNLLFLTPPSLLIDAETVADAAEYDYSPDEQPSDDQPLSAELPGKQNPLIIPIYDLFFLPHACIRIAIILIDPILMHSLLL
jgi:hypothetical protein